MFDKDGTSHGAPYLFSFVVSAFATLAVCVMTPIKSLPPQGLRTLPKVVTALDNDSQRTANLPFDLASDAVATSFGKSAL
jgi:hypothetical protein